MNINEETARQMLDALFSSLEDLETQSAAILQFLKDKGLANDKDLAPYFEQAGKASSVRWRAARVRIDYLLSSALKPPKKVSGDESPKEKEKDIEKEKGAESEKSGPKEKKTEEEKTEEEKTEKEKVAEPAGAPGKEAAREKNAINLETPKIDKPERKEEAAADSPKGLTDQRKASSDRSEDERAKAEPTHSEPSDRKSPQQKSGKEDERKTAS